MSRSRFSLISRFSTKSFPPLLHRLLRRSLVVSFQPPTPEIMTSQSTNSPIDERTLILFDVDGTLSRSRLPMTTEMEAFLAKLRQKAKIGLVGGSDLRKIIEQTSTVGLGGDAALKEVLAKYDYVFSENGLIAYRGGEQISRQSIIDKIGDDNLQRVLNFALHYLSEIQLPVKRGNFVEFRTGMINISPIGRSCTQSERIEFFEYDKVHLIRQKMANVLREKFGTELGLEFAIGGQISIDCFPIGWDKRFCLQFVEKDFDRIYFFGDQTQPGGNDHEIFADERTIGHTVVSPEDTKRQLEQMFF